MAEDRIPEAPLTLAGMRRRMSTRRPATQQPDLFSHLLDGRNDAPEQASATQVPGPDDTLSRPFAPPHKSLPAPPTAPPKTEAPAATLVSPPPLPAANALASEPMPRAWTVSGLVRHVRGVVERGYGQVTVEGEISNWRPAGSGHCYYVVKDAQAQLSAVLFRRQASLLRFRPADGDAVRVHGQLSVYESRGQMQLIVEWMEQVGLGALLAEVQRLKERLRGEGLFDRKRPLPPFPRCIGIVTSLHGAALRAHPVRRGRAPHCCTPPHRGADHPPARPAAPGRIL